MTEVRISVHYTKPEGGGVESVDVTWDGAPDAETVAAVLARMLPPMRPEVARFAGPLAGDQCRRTLCGHPKDSHSSFMRSPKDGGNLRVDMGEGWCGQCANLEKCEYFVGPGGS